VSLLPLKNPFRGLIERPNNSCLCITVAQCVFNNSILIPGWPSLSNNWNENFQGGTAAVQGLMFGQANIAGLFNSEVGGGVDISD